MVIYLFEMWSRVREEVLVRGKREKKREWILQLLNLSHPMSATMLTARMRQAESRSLKLHLGVPHRMERHKYFDPSVASQDGLAGCLIGSGESQTTQSHILLWNIKVPSGSLTHNIYSSSTFFFLFSIFDDCINFPSYLAFVLKFGEISSQLNIWKDNKVTIITSHFKSSIFCQL